VNYYVTANGPGEVMGWLRPYLRALYEREPRAKVTVVLLPCAYATGKEAQAVARMFPDAAVLDPKAYTRFLMGRKPAGLDRHGGVLQYLGGDLFHAKMIARRLHLRAMTYKFTRRSYAKYFDRFYAMDEGNASLMRSMGAPPDRVRVVGNLVADAVVGSLEHLPPPPGTGEGICILPGSRTYELQYLMPFFLAVACGIARARPDAKITFVVSPFNSDEELAAAAAWPGDPAHFGVAGRYSAGAAVISVGEYRFGVDRTADYRTMARSRLVISIPGTKTMEAAILGRALLVAVPLNRVEPIAMNGVWGYVHRVPLIGKPIKRWIAKVAERRIKFFAQPNIDAGRMIAPEMRGVLVPEDVACQAVAMLDDPHGSRIMGEALASLYATHVGSASRMVDDMLALAGRTDARQVAS
jgi:lipid-A-disaccharide synthase